MKIKENNGGGAFGIIQMQSNGVIKQVGLTESQYHILKTLLSQFSETNPLPLLPSRYDL